jgi:hypothetical protein
MLKSFKLLFVVMFAVHCVAQQSSYTYDPPGNTIGVVSGGGSSPVVEAQPQAGLFQTNGVVSFTVTASGAGLSYQWLSNGVPIAGATGDTLSLVNLTATSSGSFSVVIRNSSGSVTSSPAALWLDSRGVGMPDWWQMQYFGNLDQPPDGDYDGDGVDNLDEYLEGTNPTNPASYDPRLYILPSSLGTVVASPASPYYTMGESVALTAIPNSGQQFLGWSGPASGTNSTISLIMNSNSTIIASFGLPLPVALDDTNLIWTTGGSAPWFGQTQISEDGIGAAQSGAIVGGQESWLQSVVSVNQLMQLNFWWDVSSQSPDDLSFSIDGNVETSIAGTAVGWQRVSVILPVGLHTLDWTYTKQSNDNPTGIPFADSGWVDEVTLTTNIMPAVLTAGGYASAVLANNPIAYYLLNETNGSTAYDFVGGHNGTYQSAAVQGQPGVPNPPFFGFQTNNLAVGLNNTASNSWVLAPFGTLGVNNVTFTAWIYPIGIQNAYAGIIYDNTGAIGGVGYYSSSQMIGYTWNNGNPDTYEWASDLIPPTNQWSLVALTISPTQAVVYLYNTNAQRSATNAIAHTPDVLGNNWHIGNNAFADPGRTFNGLIDDVAIFTNTLTQQQIMNLYMAASNGASLSIVSQPVATQVLAGEMAQFSMVALGGGQLSYQWWFNGNQLANGNGLSGANAATLTISNAAAANAGNYWVVVSNTVGNVSTTSAAVPLTVDTPNCAYEELVNSLTPIAYYRLDETNGSTAYDFVGGHNGTYQSAAAQGQPGVPNPPFFGFQTNNLSVGLNDTTANSWVFAPFGTLGVSNVTFTAWIYPNGVQNAWAGIIYNRTGTPGGVGFYSSSQMIGYTWNDANSDTYDWASGLIPPINEWSLVALTISPTQAVVYLYNTNAQLSATNAIAHTPDVFGNNWHIGNDALADPVRTFNGLIDDVAIFPFSLTPAQVKNLFSTAVNAPQVELNLKTSGKNFVVSWPSGTLQSAPTVMGPWTSLSGTNSPYTLGPTGTQQYFRVKVQ